MISTKKFLAVFFLIAALTSAFCLSLGFAKTSAAATETPLMKVEKVTNDTRYNQEGTTVFVGGNAFEVKKPKDFEDEKYKVYYALDYGVSTPNLSNWYQSATWHLALSNKEQTIFKTENFAQTSNIYAAFILVEGATLQEEESYANLIQKADAYGPIERSDNFSYDVNSPDIYILNKDNQKILNRDIANLGRFYVPATFFFEDSALSSGIEKVEINKYNGDLLLINDKTQIQAGIKLDPSDPLYRSLGVREITITVSDSMGNKTSVQFKMGYPEKENVKYNAEFEPEIGTIVSFVKHQKELLGISDEDMAGVDEVLKEYRDAYSLLSSAIDNFNLRYSALLDLKGFTVGTISSYAAAIKNCEDAYSILHQVEQKNAAALVYSKFLDYKQQFDRKRFSSNGITVLPVSSVEMQNNADYYHYYLTAEQVILTEDKLVVQNLKSVLTSNPVHIERYTFQFRLGDEDVTSQFIGTKIRVEVRLTDAFNIDRNIVPFGAIFDGEKYSSKPTLIDKGYAVIDGITLTQTLQIFMSKTEGLPAWAIALIAIGGCLIVGGVTITIWIVYKKKSKDPEKKLQELHEKYEQQKRLVEIAQKAKEEEELLNKSHMEEIEKERQSAIETVKRERLKTLQEKAARLKSDALKAEEERLRRELEEYERAALEKSKQETEAQPGPLKNVQDEPKPNDLEKQPQKTRKTTAKNRTSKKKKH